LRSAGFETREAMCGEDALAQVEALRGRLDVLIVDYDLGAGLTGTEVAEDFARLLGHAVPTVMLTGDPANAEVPWLADAPVWVARKPLQAETLLAALPPLVAFRRAVARPAQQLAALSPSACTAAGRAAVSSRCP
jgi:CheY-like chemotaxis protein